MKKVMGYTIEELRDLNMDAYNRAVRDNRYNNKQEVEREVGAMYDSLLLEKFPHVLFEGTGGHINVKDYVHALGKERDVKTLCRFCLVDEDTIYEEAKMDFRLYRSDLMTVTEELPSIHVFAVVNSTREKIINEIKDWIQEDFHEKLADIRYSLIVYRNHLFSDEVVADRLATENLLFTSMGRRISLDICDMV